MANKQSKQLQVSVSTDRAELPSKGPLEGNYEPVGQRPIEDPQDTETEMGIVYGSRYELLKSLASSRTKRKEKIGRRSKVR